MKFIIALIVISMGLMTLETAQADGLKGVFILGGESGGERFAQINSTNGSLPDIKVGSGVVMKIGLAMMRDEFETRVTVGYKFASTTAIDSTYSVNWNAIPIEAIELYQLSMVSVGIGFSYNINNQLIINSPTIKQSYNFENTLGTVAQIECGQESLPTHIGLRYTAIQYNQSSEAVSQKFNGNTIGLYVRANF